MKNITFKFILLITCFAVFVPFYPVDIGHGLDPSWRFSLNELVSKKVPFGQDIFFTFGPLASVYTKTYHPGTDLLMLISSALIAVSFFFLLVPLITHAKTYKKFFLLTYLAGFIYFFDALFFLFFSLIFFNLEKFVVTKNIENTKIYFLIIYFVLGSFVLIKGSFFVPVLITICVSSYILFRNKHFILCASSIFLPIICMMLYWIYTSNSLFFLDDYIYGILQISKDYSEAMSLIGPTKHIISFLILFIFFIISLFINSNFNGYDKLAYILGHFAIFFLVFKSSFVRHDSHAVLAQVFVLGFFIFFIASNSSKNIWICFLPLLFTWVLIDREYIKTTPNIIYSQTANTYYSFFNGIKNRLFKDDFFKKRFEKSKEKINDEYRLEKLNGTTDIYSFDQTALIVSDNLWQPRPVFQSYAAYNSYLLRKNFDHLSIHKKPDHIFFKINPIDNRFPLMEEGPSYLKFLENYHVVKNKNDHLILSKNEIAKSLNLLYSSEYELNLSEEFSLPKYSKGFLYLKLNIKKSYLGKLINFIFKISPLMLNVTYENGSSIQYRIISGMIEEGFIISPAITDNFEFETFLSKKEVRNKSLPKTIMIYSKNNHYWQSSIKLSIEHYDF